MGVAVSVQPIQPRWAKIKDAILYSGLGEKRLKNLAGDPDSVVFGYQDIERRRGRGLGEWVFDLRSLDNYHRKKAQSQGVIDEDALVRQKLREL